MVATPGGGRDHVGDGVDDVHGGGQAAGVVVVAVVRATGPSSTCTCGSPVDEDAVALALRPVGRVLVAQAGDVLDDDARLAADHARRSRSACPRSSPAAIVPGRDLERPRRRG